MKHRLHGRQLKLRVLAAQAMTRLQGRWQAPRVLALQAMPRLHGRPLETGVWQMQLVTRLQGKCDLGPPTPRTLRRQQALRAPKDHIMTRPQAKHLGLRALQAPAMSSLQGRVSSAAACNFAVQS